MARTDLTKTTYPGSYAASGALVSEAAADVSNGNQFTFVGEEVIVVRNSETPKVVTITIATPGVVAWVGHPFVGTEKVRIKTTGALPTGLAVDTVYFVKADADADTFHLAATSGGSNINTTGSQSGTHTMYIVHSVTLASAADEMGRTGDVTSELINAGDIHIFGPMNIRGWRQSNGKFNINADHIANKFSVFSK